MNKVLDTLNKKILTANKFEDFINQCKNLNTDEERIIFTLKAMMDYDIIPQACRETKNAEDSERLREQGNMIFVLLPLTSANCIKALKLYTESIAHAPYPSEQLALSYANRSAVLIKLHKYKECIQDIDRALALSYPDNLKPKLYIRKVECLQVLKDPSTEDNIKEAQRWLEKMSLNDVNYKKLNNKLISIKGTLKSWNSENQNTTRHQIKLPVPTIGTPNIEVPCASDAVTVVYNKQYGRHIIATRKIEPGEIIAIEKPYSFLLTPDNIYTHCSNCLEVSWANIPCNYCTYAMYCSEECKASEWKRYHDVECPIFQSVLKMNVLKLDLFSLRLAIQIVRESSSIQELREELNDVDSSDDPRTKGFSKNGILESNKYRSVLGLVTNAEKRSVQDLFRRSLDASFILYFLATCTNMFGSPLEKDLSVLIKNSDVIFVGGLILRQQQMIPCNIHSISEERGLEVAERGIAVMSFHSLINHSCSSNIYRDSRSMHNVIYAIYPIEQGEQVFDIYTQHYAVTPKNVRQIKLLKQYYFKCNCIACEESWPLYYDFQSFQSLVKKKEDKKKIIRVLRKLNTYVSIATEGNVLDKPYIIDDLLNMIKVLYNLVPLHCEEMNSVVETLKRVYSLIGNRFEIPEL